MNSEIQYALIGGAFIGLSASILMLSIGKICGLSGIFESLMKDPKKIWRWIFLFGFLSGALLIRWWKPGFAQASEYNLNLPLSILAGLLVGYGTRLAGGCTSGHGVCGISRFSKRSIVSTLLFMISAALVVWIRRVL